MRMRSLSSVTAATPPIPSTSLPAHDANINSSTTSLPASASASASTSASASGGRNHSAALMLQPGAPLESKLLAALDARRAVQSCRTLTIATDDGTASGVPLADFSSNDYLGLARDQTLQARLLQPPTTSTMDEHALRDRAVGSTGSRLLTGNNGLYECVERLVRDFHGGAAGLIFNSGYDANLGIFGSLPQRGDVIFVDELIHASVHEGLKLSRGSKVTFRHNDLADLERKLEQAARQSAGLREPSTGGSNRSSGTAESSEGPTAPAAGRTRSFLIAVESVYSMDGDCAPLVELAQLAERWNAALIVDEAHGTGVMGDRGQGLVGALGVENRVFARVHTFGKALGAHGAIVISSPVVREYLVNYARSLVYTTSLPPHSLLSIAHAYRRLEEVGSERRAKVLDLIQHFRTRIQTCSNARIARALLPSDTPIQGLVVPGNAQVVALARHLRKRGMNALPIRSPTVPTGAERLRIIVHAHNTVQQIDGLVAAIEEYFASEDSSTDSPVVKAVPAPAVVSSL
ncbi:8-amino-7-oxononanoate synthase [Capsaspora owczarzaki ATCC 30864]|nr:8-amino-7-oxononanoate synthase [Capsaspora owczarzaki ATCC 30864]|eukprot:XP_004365272.1 8-amino-7-oxononanoate synthase [Capsaspora owczarzaki ATCC 30864]